jgi:hypothetical protein
MFFLLAFNRLFGVVLGAFWYYNAKEMLKLFFVAFFITPSKQGIFMRSRLLRLIMS